MTTPIDALNKAFDSRIRLGIMALLLVNDSVDYTALKTQLNLTDGNLASHLKALEKEDFIAVHKTFIGRKPNTQYRATEKGTQAFRRHLNALEKLIQSSQPEE